MLLRGAKAGLLGRSARSLALWVCERKLSQEDRRLIFFLMSPVQSSVTVCMTNGMTETGFGFIWSIGACKPKEDLVLHECTGRFLRWILTTFLPEYSWTTLQKSADTGEPVAIPDDPDGTPFLISPLHVGWPMHRPRLFSVGTLRRSCAFHSLGKFEGSSDSDSKTSSFTRITELFAKPSLTCECLYCAPKAS